ncbi:MAG TPA: hypothetical protein PLR78_08710, partial [Polaromonas sp.]|uniref:hypothetical protein n=1 Tax=Polaromonas sp. TaxID=1869339 RepID=UPI002C247914
GQRRVHVVGLAGRVRVFHHGNVGLPQASDLIWIKSRLSSVKAPGKPRRRVGPKSFRTAGPTT